MCVEISGSILGLSMQCLSRRKFFHGMYGKVVSLFKWPFSTFCLVFSSKEATALSYLQVRECPPIVSVFLHVALRTFLIPCHHHKWYKGMLRKKFSFPQPCKINSRTIFLRYVWWRKVETWSGSERQQYILCTYHSSIVMRTGTFTSTFNFGEVLTLLLHKTS